MARRVTICLAVALAGALLGPCPARAGVTLSPASLTINYRDYASGVSTFVHTQTAASGGASGSVNEISGPSLSATSSATTFMGTSLSYYAAIEGPAGVTSVPIDISYSYALVTSTAPGANPSGNPSGASAYFGYTGVNNTYFVLANTNDSNAVANGTTQSVSISGIYTTTAPVNAPLRLGLSAGANGAGGSAFLDPAISIDPSFFLANPQYSASDFTIIDSSGVGNGLVADVPEPGGAALLAFSLAGLGLALRFRPAATAC